MKQKEDFDKRIRTFVFSPKERIVSLGLAGGKITTQETQSLFQDFIFDDESTVNLLSLAILGYKNGWSGFPENTIPRLKGIHRYYQTKNAAAFPWIKRQLNYLKICNIPYILVGGMALRALYSSDIPRVMDVYDIVVPSNQYEKAVEILRNETRLNYKNEKNTPAALIRVKKGVPDQRVFSEKEFWSRAVPYQYLNQDSLVSSIEDMLMQLICIPYGPWILNENAPERSRRLSEIIRLIPRVEPALLEKIAIQAGMNDVVAFYIRLFANWMPEIIDESKWYRYLFPTKSYRQYCKKLWLACQTKANLERKPGRVKKIMNKLAAWNVVHYLKSANCRDGIGEE